MIDLETITPQARPSDAAAYLESLIYFSPAVSPNNSGYLSLERQPWMREILNQVLNPAVREIVISTGAQLGKSTMLLLATLLCLEFRQGAGMWLLPTDKMATRAVKKRILPLLDCNVEHYGAYLPCGQVSYADSIPLKGFPLYYSGVRNAAKLASVPANIVIMDEAAKFERGDSKEADPISLAMERTKSFADSLVIMASTPNVEESKFWQAYLEGTQSHFLMPCPHCGGEMEFAWGRESVVWDDGKPETAKIICPHCQQSINDAERLAMMAEGHWVDANPAAREAGKLSFHLNSLYSPYITTAEMAAKYHAAANSLTKKSDLQNFQNSWLALPWVEHAVKIYDDDIRACVDDLSSRGIVPADYQLLVMGVDIGQNQSHYVTTAIKDDGRLQIVDWGIVVNYKTENGQAGIASIFDSVVYHDAAGNDVRPDLCLIDSGYDTSGVYDECLKASVPGTIIPVKGSAGTMGAWARSKIRTLPYAPFDLIVFSDFQLKRSLYLDAVKKKRLIIPKEADFPLIQGLSGQEMKKSSTGKPYFKELANDHFGDGLKFAILAQWICAADRQ